MPGSMRRSAVRAVTAVDSRFPTLGVAPCSQLPPNGHELPNVVRGVVGDEEDLADVCLAIAVRDLREQIDGLIHRERLERRAILTKRADRIFPRTLRRRLGRFRPVVLWPREL